MKDKPKNIITGSIEEIPGDALEIVEGDPEKIYKDLEIKAIDQKVSPEEVEEMLQKLLDSDWGEEVIEEMCTPAYMLSLGKDIEYLYSISRKTFVPVKNNIEVIPVSTHGLPPESALLLKNYYSVNNEIFDIDPSKVVCIGWN